MALIYDSFRIILTSGDFLLIIYFVRKNENGGRGGIWPRLSPSSDGSGWPPARGLTCRLLVKHRSAVQISTQHAQACFSLCPISLRSIVPRGRFELPRDCSHSDLNATCLPVPPPGQYNRGREDFIKRSDTLKFHYSTTDMVLSTIATGEHALYLYTTD